MARSASQEGQQVGVDLILMGRGEAVWRTGIVDLLRALDEPGRLPSRVLHRDDLVVLAVQDQGRDIELLEVLGEIGLGEGLDALVGVLEPGLHAPEPELIERALSNLGPRSLAALQRNRNAPLQLP